MGRFRPIVQLRELQDLLGIPAPGPPKSSERLFESFYTTRAAGYTTRAAGLGTELPICPLSELLRTSGRSPCPAECILQTVGKASPLQVDRLV